MFCERIVMVLDDRILLYKYMRKYMIEIHWAKGWCGEKEKEVEGFFENVSQQTWIMKVAAQSIVWAPGA